MTNFLYLGKTYQNSSDYSKRQEKRKDCFANLCKLMRMGVNILATPEVLWEAPRYLTPIYKDGLKGFINKMGEIVIEPIYEEFIGNFKEPEDKIAVKDASLRAKPWMIINSQGDNIDCQKRSFYLAAPSPDSSFFAVQEERYSPMYIYDASLGDFIQPKIGYQLISGFYKGFSRVKQNDKWGIVDTEGRIVVPIEYDNIWNFVGRYDRSTTRMERKGKYVGDFNFITGEVTLH